MQENRVDPVEIGRRLRELRGIRTKIGLARELGVSYSSYCSYEAGLRNPSGNVKQKIADYFGVSVESIFYAQQ